MSEAKSAEPGAQGAVPQPKGEAAADHPEPRHAEVSARWHRSTKIETNDHDHRLNAQKTFRRFQERLRHVHEGLSPAPQKVKYIDPAFPPNSKSVSKSLQSQKFEWRRPEDIGAKDAPAWVLTRDGMKPSDVYQVGGVCVCSCLPCLASSHRLPFRASWATAGS